MYNLGYRIFDAQVAACWKQKNKTNKSLYGKEKKIGFEYLFVKTPESLKALPLNHLLKVLCILECYGFADYSLFLLETLPNIPDSIKNEFINELLINNEVEKTLFEKLKRAVGFHKNIIYPSLHY